jgi:hypothetical protein
MDIPEEYIIQKFYQHAGYPKYTKSTNTYTGGCSICREGKSWGRKSRLYYIPKDSVVCCHNCGWYGGSLKWIMEVASLSYNEVMDEISSGCFEYGLPVEEKPVIQTPDLPKDSINLFDKTQVMFYRDNNIVKMAVEMIVDRRLNTAENRPKALYISLNDYVHKNRLILPFYDHHGQCMFYQTRTILEKDNNKPKYLSKMNGDKTLFNYNNIDSATDNIFITEGPIDSFFIKNSVAVAGIQEKSKGSLTTTQKDQLDRMFLMEPVWVLDSQWLDQASLLKTERLLNSGACCFLWPESLGRRFKDINDVCIHFDINCITDSYILSNTYCGASGLVRLKQIK